MENVNSTGTIQYPYAFSVVMAAYNVESYLREAIDSLIAQDFGFSHIELILVDDGSKDGTGAICDEYVRRYPNNIRVLHKENGGVASARNAGLSMASGRFLNFMDSDDKFTPDAFRRVYSFFTAHEEETDVVTVPLEFFGDKIGPHWQNWKFDAGTRVVDLRMEPDNPAKFVNASFFTHRIKPIIDFDGKLVTGEDMKVILTVLAEKMKLGLVTGCSYLYRQRGAGGMGLVQTSRKKRGWYTDYFTYLVDWAATYFQERCGEIPDFVQYELLSDLQWRFSQVYDMTQVLSLEDIEAYKQRLYASLRYFDDRCILSLRELGDEYKCLLLRKKHGCFPTLTPKGNDIAVHFGDIALAPFSRHLTRLDFIELSGGEVRLEGVIKIFGEETPRPVEVYLVSNGQELPCEIISRTRIDEFRLGEQIYRGVAFRCNVPLSGRKLILRFAIRYGDCFIYRETLKCSGFLPVSTEYRYSCYRKDGWLLRIDAGGTIWLNLCGALHKFLLELAFQWELWRSNGLGERKAALARLACLLLSPFKMKPLWLVSDRLMFAGDNGEAFFRYLRKEHRHDIRAVFVLKQESIDYGRMREIGPVVDALSFRHKLMHLLCDRNISASADDTIMNPFHGYSAPYRDLEYGNKFVFLQHGVIKDDLSDWLHRYRKNLGGFVTSAKPEYDSILSGDYGYSQREVWLTGLPRFDLLYHDEKRIVTLIPTWRKYIMSGQDGATGLWILEDNFETTAFYRFYHDLLNHQRLLDAVEACGYRLSWFPHPNLRVCTELLKPDPRVLTWTPETLHRDVYAQSELVVTDYSSAVFDFAYLRKPVLYCQFDREEFYQGEHVYTEGYFDYQRDGFGEVEEDLERLVDRIIEYLDRKCMLKQRYRERIDRFFAFNDKENCKRVYEKTKSMERM